MQNHCDICDSDYALIHSYCAQCGREFGNPGKLDIRIIDYFICSVLGHDNIRLFDIKNDRILYTIKPESSIRLVFKDLIKYNNHKKLGATIPFFLQKITHTPSGVIYNNIRDNDKFLEEFQSQEYYYDLIPYCESYSVFTRDEIDKKYNKILKTLKMEIPIILTETILGFKFNVIDPKFSKYCEFINNTKYVMNLSKHELGIKEFGQLIKSDPKKIREINGMIFLYIANIIMIIFMFVIVKIIEWVRS